MASQEGAVEGDSASKQNLNYYGVNKDKIKELAKGLNDPRIPDRDNVRSKLDGILFVPAGCDPNNGSWLLGKCIAKENADDKSDPWWVCCVAVNVT